MVASLAISRLVYLPFIRRGTTQFATVMITVAMAIIIKNVLQIFTGATFYSYALAPQKSIHVLGMVFTPRQLAIIAVAAGSMLGAPPAVPLHAPRQGDARDLGRPRARAELRHTDDARRSAGRG